MQRLLSRQYSFLVLALLVLAACSKYQPFTIGTYNGHALQNQRWEVTLPYTSGKALVIEAVSSDGLLVCEQEVHFFTKSFHVVRIPFGQDGQLQTPMYSVLENGESCEVLETGHILISEKQKRGQSMTFLNPTTLTPYFSINMQFQTGGQTSLTGQKQVSDTLIVYHTEVSLDWVRWQDSSYRYSVPFIKSSQYDIYLINLTNGNVRSFVNLDEQKLPKLNSLTREASFRSAHEKRWKRIPIKNAEEQPSEGPLDHTLYYINDVYLLQQATSLIVELENTAGERLYYLFDLHQASPVPEWKLAGDLVKKYPYELSLIERDLLKEANRRRSQDVVVSGITYKPEHAELFLDNIVMIGRKKSSSSDYYARERMAIGIATESFLTPSMEEGWRYPFHHPYRLDRIITDSVHETAYIVDVATDGTFNVVGLVARDGRRLPGFPANIQMERERDEPNTFNSFTLNIVGTMVDFTQQLVFLHNQQKNSIICADLNLSH